MARIRTIKPEFPQSESMGRVSRESRLCFVQLWTVADDSGRLRGNSRMLASLLYPYDDDAKDLIDDWLDELDAEDAIVRYEVEGNAYIEIRKWLDHQKIDKPTPSKLPPFDESSRILANPTRRKGVDQGVDRGPTTASQKPEADADFEEAWKLYPKRAGGDPKGRALKAWRARRKEGHSVEDIKAGVMRYAAFARASGKEHTEYVMQAATFFGPDRQFLEPWNPPQEKAKPTEWWSSDSATEAKGRELGLSPRAGEGWPQFKDRIRAKLNERMAA